MSDPDRPPACMGELGGALPLAAVALLAFNDHVAKAAWPGPVTGKLSDVAGCFLLPLLVSALLGLATRWRLSMRLASGAAITAVLFGSIKLSAAAADGVAAALSAVGGLAGLPSSAIVADATDLLALPFVGLAAWYGSWAARRTRTLLPFAGRLALGSASVVVLTATSLAHTCPPESGLLEAPIAYWAETDCGPPGPVVLRVEPATCMASLEGGDAAQLGRSGSVYWRQGFIDLFHDAPVPGIAIPEGHELTSRCLLRPKKKQLERIDVECTRWLVKPGKSRWKEVQRCSGTLRRLRPPSGPGEPRPPPAGG